MAFFVALVSLVSCAALLCCCFFLQPQKVCHGKIKTIRLIAKNWRIFRGAVFKIYIGIRQKCGANCGRMCAVILA